ncbi:hypothetical protein Tco_1221898, partial [Tanacetum coccineum]
MFVSRLSSTSKGLQAVQSSYKDQVCVRDVQFHEEIFPYSQPHMLELINPLPSPFSQVTHWYDDYVTTTAPNVAIQVPSIPTSNAESVNETAQAESLNTSA